MDQKFYVCRHCGNIIAYAKSSGVPVVCCGEEMREMIPNTTDAAQEKHVPMIVQENGRVIVRIGSVPHPMTDAHYIEWICLHTTQGNQRKLLQPEDAPEACFVICDGDEIVSAQAYCNLHGLWKKSIE